MTPAMVQQRFTQTSMKREMEHIMTFLIGSPKQFAFVILLWQIHAPYPCASVYNMPSWGNNVAARARVWKKSNIGVEAPGWTAGTSATRSFCMHLFFSTLLQCFWLSAFQCGVDVNWLGWAKFEVDEAMPMMGRAKGKQTKLTDGDSRGRQTTLELNIQQITLSWQ